MGSYNSSGFISKLPIRRGDRVVCFIATENPYSSIRNLYIPDCHLVPWGIPVRGEYNDYGSIENIDEDFNTEFLKKLFKVDDVEEIFYAIDRCLYGDSLDENIKYWKHNKEEVKKYKMLLPMYGNVKEHMKWMNSSLGKKRPVQPLCTLMFEHEKIYDYVTRKDYDCGWEHIDILNEFEEHKKVMSLCEEIEKLETDYFGEKDSSDKSLKQFKHLFSQSGFERNDFFYLKYTIKDNPIEGKEDVIKAIKAKIEEYEELNEHNHRLWSGEGRSPMFMVQFNFMKYETYLKFLEEKKDEIIRFIRLMRYMASMPLIFEPSITAGQQHYNSNGFRELFNFMHNFTEEYFVDEEDYDDYNED